jgi:hypothetical protein
VLTDFIFEFSVCKCCGHWNMVFGVLF